MSTPRKICVVTGARAEYGLLYWLMKEIIADKDLRLQVVVTAMHLSPEFGLTYRDIEADGFAIDTRVEMLLSSDTPTGVAKSTGLGVIGFADTFDRLRPDILVLLGDRFEILAAAQAALLARIPIAHIHGGETSEGAVDEAIRHAVTKMAQWHFVAADAYRVRVVQLGESPDRVFNFGAPGLDHLARNELLTRESLEAALETSLRSPVFAVTYHPATLGDRPPQAAMQELLAALDAFPEASVVLTYPNADAGGRAIIELLQHWVEQNRHRSRAFVALGQRRYLSLLASADVVIGNSSSGIIEAPALHKATVNIGDRQRGRLRASSVIDTGEDRAAIAAGIRKALSEEHRAIVRQTRSLYGSGEASRRIKETLKSVAIGTQKQFFDIPHDR